MIKLVRKIIDDEVATVSSQLAYSLLMAFFPFLIFVMTVIGFSSINYEYILVEFKRILPNEAYKLVYNTLVEIITNSNSNLLSFGLILTIWASSNGVRSIIKGLNKAYNEKEKRSYLKIVLLSMGITLALGFLIILTLALLVFGELVGDFILMRTKINPYFFNMTWNMLRYAVILISMIFVFALVYRYTPSLKLKWHEVLPGAVFATVGWVTVSLGFAFYVNNFGNYSKLYGSIGAVIVLLTWLYLTSFIIIIGGEVNAWLALEIE